MRLNTVFQMGRKYDFVIVVSLLWFMVQFLRFIFPPLFETFQVIYGVSNTETGFLFTAMMAAYAIVQFPAGVLGDKFGRPLVMVGSVGIFALSALFIAGGTNFLFITMFSILLGLGSGPHKAVAIPLLSNQYTDQTGRALGVMDTIGQFGGMVAPLVVVLFLSIYVWQGIFILASIVSIFLGALLILNVHRSELLSFTTSSVDDTTNSKSANHDYLAVFRNQGLLIFVVITMTFTFAWNGFSAFFPLFLATEKGLSVSTAGISYSLLFVASLSQTVTGDLSDRVGKLRIGSLLFVVSFVGIICLLFVENTTFIMILSLITGIGFHGFRPVRDSYLMDIIPDNIGGGTLGIIRTCMTGVGALAPAFIGLISDIMNFTVAYGIIGFVAASGCFLMFGLRFLEGPVDI